MQKTTLLIFITCLSHANNSFPQWSSIDALRISDDEKNVYAFVKLDDETSQLIFIHANPDTNLLSWGFAKKTKNIDEEKYTYSPINLDVAEFLTPFELMQIRESIRNERIYYDLIVGRNLSNVEEVELNDAYKNNAFFFSHVEHFLLSSWYEQIEHYIEYRLMQRYYNFIEKVQLGTSHEKRPIYAYKTACPNNTPKVNLIWISLEHAREKSTVHSNLYAMQYFLHQLSTDPLSYCNASVWFIPILNPDGFVYANTFDEMWRKNRRPVSNTNQKGEIIEDYGVDIARNFYDPQCPQDYRFYNDQSYPEDDEACHDGKQETNTFSDNPKSNIYRGTENSEAETRALISLIDKHHPNLSFNSIITLHSAKDDGGIFHLDDQDPKDLAEYIQTALNNSGYPGYKAENIDKAYNHTIPGIPEFYMHNRGIPMLTIELKLNQDLVCYNRFDPPLKQYQEDQQVTKHALMANIRYWQSRFNRDSP